MEIIKKMSAPSQFKCLIKIYEVEKKIRGNYLLR